METRYLWIDNRAVEGGGPPTEVIDPATEKAFGYSCTALESDADQAVAAARRALPGWRSTPATERAQALREVARRLRQNLETIATELTLETGRSIRKNRGYVEFTAQCFEYYAELARHSQGRVIPSPERGQLSLVLKEPVGVVAAIVPWNYPLLLLAWKLAPALAAGNTVVVKPAAYTPWTTLGLSRYMDHLPPGVVNLVAGSGSLIGDHLVRHPEVRMIAFTGSVEVGQHIMRRAADEVKHIHLELGGKDPLIVCEDADIDAAARAAVWGAFLNAGQVCTSIERAYVDRRVLGPFLDQVIRLTRSLTLGPGSDPESEVTPMIRGRERQKVIDQVEGARAAGAEVLTGGAIPGEPRTGVYYQPTVLTGVNDSMEVLREETFGPVLPIVEVEDFEQALESANRSVYGLGATLFSRDPAKARRYMEAIEAGNVWINDPLIDNLAGPFGGMKRSGLGRELGEEGLQAFQETKHVHWDIEGGVKPWWFPWTGEGSAL